VTARPPLRIPFGAEAWPLARLDEQPPPAPLLALDPAVASLRLDNFPYDFPEPPDLHGMRTRAVRLEFLLRHFQSFCGIWDKLRLLFLEAYFRMIAEEVTRAAESIRAIAGEHAGLFAPEDWCYAAAAPLPIAHLPLGGEEHVRTDIAFWFEGRLHAVELIGGAEPALRAEARERLRSAGIEVTEIAGAALRRSGAAALRESLPAPLVAFWRGVTLPASPFRLGSLREIAPGARY